MSTLRLVKSGPVLIPADPDSEERVRRLLPGAFLEGDIKSRRNPQFHRKFFALLKIGFDLWEPGELATEGAYGHGVPEKSFDQYRKQVTIQAGCYYPVFSMDGSFTLEAKSISFASMDEDEFAGLFSRAIDVILKNLSGTSREDLMAAVEQAERVVQFA